MQIFLSSTCYDLIDLRSELEIFFRDAGANPIMSDSLTSDFVVMPDRNSIETCLANVRNCDHFVIILSNRYGPTLEKLGFESISATHLEYREALQLNKPIHMYVRDKLEADYNIWRKNRSNSELELTWCKDRKNWKIYELLEEHRNRAEKTQNNWTWVFRNSMELKRRLELDFQEVFARVVANRLMENGRVPFLEIRGEITGMQDQFVLFNLLIRNVGEVVALAPVIKINGTVNTWTIRSLQPGEQHTIAAKWFVETGSLLKLSSSLSYDILEGHRFVDEGVLTFRFLQFQGEEIGLRYQLDKRRYLGASSENLLLQT